jgi:hypothetical protein
MGSDLYDEVCAFSWTYTLYFRAVLWTCVCVVFGNSNFSSFFSSTFFFSSRVSKWQHAFDPGLHGRGGGRSEV